MNKQGCVFYLSHPIWCRMNKQGCVFYLILQRDLSFRAQRRISFP
ncbi:MAG: hypothetical protein ACPGWR_19915 [Ardenticatenaceae bacterium]